MWFVLFYFVFLLLSLLFLLDSNFQGVPMTSTKCSAMTSAKSLHNFFVFVHCNELSVLSASGKEVLCLAPSGGRWAAVQSFHHSPVQNLLLSRKTSQGFPKLIVLF